MQDDNLLAKRGKALEEDYFRRKEQELVEKLRQRNAAAARLKELSEATGIPDQEILQTLQELGYTRATVALLHLVPLIQVGWADGKLDQAEREQILEAARLRGVVEGSAAYEQLIDWLENRPSEEFFEQTLSIISRLLETMPDTDRRRGEGVLADSIRVASVSGGILGFGNKISDEEKALLHRIAKTLGADSSSIDQ
jgi:tellurite resistance protein